MPKNATGVFMGKRLRIDRLMGALSQRIEVVRHFSENKLILDYLSGAPLDFVAILHRLKYLEIRLAIKATGNSFS
jgi:hypothetical protein